MKKRVHKGYAIVENSKNITILETYEIIMKSTYYQSLQMDVTQDKMFITLWSIYFKIVYYFFYQLGDPYQKMTL